jgi:hypothetical protein
MSGNGSVLSAGALEIHEDDTHFGFGYRFEPERSHPFHNAATAS